MSDNGSVSMYFLGDELFASSESDIVRRVDPSTLATHPIPTRHSTHLAVTNLTAHPHYDAQTGDVFNMGNIFTKGYYYNIVRLPKALRSSQAYDKGKVVASLRAANSLKPSYYHSFGLTDRYLV